MIFIGIFMIVYLGWFGFRTRRIVFGSFLAALIIFFLGKVVAIETIGILSSVIGEGWTNDRLMIVNEFLLYGNDISSLTGAREFTRSISINNFLENPFVGSIISNSQGISEGLEGFGQHSFILDTFALFGVVIGFVNLYLIIYPFILRMKKGNAITKWFSVAILVLTTLFFYINNAVPSIGIAVYFLFPIVCDSVEKYNS